jgi:large subunit ribosomal protein L13
MKVIDGTNAVMGRLASYSAKQALQGEEVVILNCEKVIITGNRKDIQARWEQKRRRVGSRQTGPKHSRRADMIVKRAIRGMLPKANEGRGKEALKRIKCYVGVPKEFEESKKIVGGKDKKSKFIRIEKISI